MSFTSPEFLIFLAVLLVAYHAAGAARLAGWVQWGLLSVASLYFYGFKDPQLLWLLGFSITFNCMAGWLIARSVHEGRAVPGWTMGVALTVNLLLIVFFKYARLIGSLLLPAGHPILAQLQNIPLPIGISFYTFHAVSFLVDLSRANTRETSLRPFCAELAGGNLLSGLGKLSLYINFFPQLIAGPIMKARAFLPQVGFHHFTNIAWRQALRYLILGYFLKTVVADNLHEQTILISNANYAVLKKFDLLLLLYGYSCFIFADFAGYSLMALGFAALFGYRLPINFNFPYLSASITEFWRRWHISLSTWLRDYLYFPLGGNRKGTGRTYLNLFLVMFLGGLWHGAEMRFAWWGVGHGLLLMIERLLGAGGEETSVKNGSVRRMLQIFITFHLVSFLWLCFVMPDMAHITGFLQALWKNPIGANPRATYVILIYALPVVLYHVWGYLRPTWREKIATCPQDGWLEPVAYGIMLYFIITNQGVGGDFVYFNF